MRSRSEFQRLSAALPGQQAPWLAATRTQALERFAERGYPTPREEAWKYTNLAPLAGKAFQPLTGLDDVAKLDIAAWLLAPDLPRLVFVDGHYAPTLSRPPAASEGVTLGSLGEVLRSDPAAVERALASPLADQPRGLLELNTAFMSDGLCLRLAPGAVLAQPLHLIHIARSAEQARASYLRHLVLAGRNSRATLVEHYVSLDGAQALTSALTQCVLEEGAGIEHYLLNEQGEGVYHFGAAHITQARDSRYVSHNVQAGGRIARSDLLATLSEPGAECVMNGLYLGRGRQIIDNYTRIDHQAPRCTSNECYRGVLDGQSRGVFNGHVMVRQQAQHTDAQQMNHNLLMSDDAEANTRPQLEIYADDVKCSHGSTVGQLDRDALFYLRARGIGEADARAMLVRAFADDIIARVTLPALRDRLSALVGARLAN